jgi:hypothetical protein
MPQVKLQWMFTSTNSIQTTTQPLPSWRAPGVGLSEWQPLLLHLSKVGSVQPDAGLPNRENAPLVPLVPQVITDRILQHEDLPRSCLCGKVDIDHRDSRFYALGERCPMAQEFNVLALMKGQEHYIFVYDDNSRQQLLDALRDQAADPGLGLNWFDAAVLIQKARDQAALALAGTEPEERQRSRI